MYNIYPFVSYTTSSTSKLKHYILYLIHQMSDIFFSVSTFLVIIITTTIYAPKAPFLSLFNDTYT